MQLRRELAQVDGSSRFSPEGHEESDPGHSLTLIFTNDWYLPGRIYNPLISAWNSTVSNGGFNQSLRVYLKSTGYFRVSGFHSRKLSPVVIRTEKLTVVLDVKTRGASITASAGTALATPFLTQLS